MSKAALDSDLYGDIYGEEDNEFAVPTTGAPSSVEHEHDDILEDLDEPVQEVPPLKTGGAASSSPPPAQDGHRSLPAKPIPSGGGNASSGNLSYSAQVAKQFSVYQQTPSQERQQRSEASLPQNPRVNQQHQLRQTFDSGSAAASSSTDTVFGKKPSEMHDSGKMFIGGLNWDTTDEGLRDYFTQFGKVDACTIMRDPSGTSRGFAFMTFEDAAAVNIVVSRQHELDGKSIDPKRAIPREEHLRNTRYFVGGLAPTSTADSMREFFGAYGKVVDATVMLDRETGRSKGFGFVTFEDVNNADQLVGKAGLLLDDKQIEVKMAQPRSQRDQGRNASTPAVDNYEQRTSAPTTMNNMLPAAQQNPMSMMYQRSMAQMPQLAMMNMNPMMGMGFGMGAFNNMGNMGNMNNLNAMNTMNTGMPVAGMMGVGMTGGGMNGFSNMNPMAGMGPMRLGMGPMGNFAMGAAGMVGQGNQVGMRSTGAGVRSPSNGMVGQHIGRSMGNAGLGPARMTNRGQHSFHPYAR